MVNPITIFSNIFSKEPHYIEVDMALERIKTGSKSKERVLEIRTQIDRERANTLKQNLPSVCFSGKFTGERKDATIISHSGFICLDFDHIEDLQEAKDTLSASEYCYAVWVSPSGNGLKMLVKIADGAKHRLHFAALKKDFPEIDKSGVNESRVAYESFDPEIFINPKAAVYKKTLKTEFVEQQTQIENQQEIFDRIVVWLSNRGDAFVSGERNQFIFKLAAACCRFGIHELNTLNYCNTAFLRHDNTFSISECQKAIQSAYRANKQLFGNAIFESGKLIEKSTRAEVSFPTINPDIFDLEIRPKDVIFGEDVKEQAMNIYDSGYESVESMGIAELDEFFKLKRGEITLLSGIGNYGKSSLLKFILLMKAIKYDQKFALFSPEDCPASEFYHDLTEIYLGCDCTPKNKNRPTREEYNVAYDWISKHIFYVYPKTIAPTPEYIKERFLELIIKQKVDGCIIDPFNQLSNDYGMRSDKYLETFLSDCSRFAQTNDIYLIIVAHPTKLKKSNGDDNYPCPDIFDIADGAMWNNKMDNILIYHRPEHQSDPMSSRCELHTKKIRRQKMVGKKGVLEFQLNRSIRRFTFNNRDVMQEALNPTSESKVNLTEYRARNFYEAGSKEFEF